MKRVFKIFFTLSLLLLGYNSIYADSYDAYHFSSSHIVEMVKDTDFNTILSQQYSPYKFEASVKTNNLFFIDAEETDEDAGISLVKKLSAASSFDFINPFYNRLFYEAVPNIIKYSSGYGYAHYYTSQIYLLLRVIRI